MAKRRSEDSHDDPLSFVGFEAENTESFQKRANGFQRIMRKNISLGGDVSTALKEMEANGVVEKRKPIEDDPDFQEWWDKLRKFFSIRRLR